MGYTKGNVARLASRLAERINPGSNEEFATASAATASADRRQDDKQLKKLIDKKTEGAVCFDSVLYLLQVAGDKKNRFLGKILNDKSDDFRKFFFRDDYREAHNVSDIPSDSVVLIYRKPYAKKSETFDLLSHVVVSIDDNGKCAGSNNGCIGGAPNFNIVNLGEKLQWRPPDKNPLYIAMGEQGSEEYYQERLIVYQEIYRIY